MKHSIKIKLACIMVSLVALMFLLVMGINSLFLERYYSQTKEAVLMNVYNTLESIAANDESITASNNIGTLNSACESFNVTLLVLSPSGDSVYTYGASGVLKMRLVETIFGQDANKSSKVLMSTDNYKMLKIIDENNQNYVEMSGVLDAGGNYFIMRVAVESIRESVEISNRFLMIVSIIGVLFSIVVVVAASDYYTKPILELVGIAKKMSSLDFDIKYNGHRNDEIGILGDSMNELSKELEKNISELKTANLELQKDIQQKTEVDEMRKEFISNVSHELKTPIALIQGYAEGLKESVNDDDESRDFYCEVIMDEANKMNTMVKKLLTLNQIEFGSMPVSMERFNIVSVINGVLNRVKLMAQQEGITIEFICENTINVWADEFQIEEVITNYVSNAINHVKGKKIIRISVIQNKDSVRVSVFNTGDHIPKEELDNIWIKFYKVDKARTREYGGNGIGLSIVKAIMDSHGKHCGVENVDGGVEFWFDLDSNMTAKGQTNDSNN
ncbi:MAG: ATP-binding protein, partial [Eubacterium sp.]